MKILSPVRVTRTYTQHLIAEPARIFPLLCPVREADWVEGWDPLLVVSESGAAEPDCVFVTSENLGSAIWYITKHEPANGFVEMLKVAPQVTACKLSIQLRPTPSGSEATITYSHTSLGPEGDAYVAAFTQEFYLQFMRSWESQINHYLAHGSPLRATLD